MYNNKNKFFNISIGILALLIGIVSVLSLFIHDKSEKEIFASSIDKVVEICAYNDEESKFYATGCIIGNNGEILTNRHVVCYTEDEKYVPYANLFVRFYNSNHYVKAQFVKNSDEDDLALIKINLVTKRYFKISSKYNAGEKCYTIGNPNNFGLSFSAGVISAKIKNVKYDGKMISAIQTDLVISEGNSGGPLINKNGDLIGIISFRLRDSANNLIYGVSFALNDATLNSFVKSL